MIGRNHESISDLSQDAQRRICSFKYQLSWGIFDAKADEVDYLFIACLPKLIITQVKMENLEIVLKSVN